MSAALRRINKEYKDFAVEAKEYSQNFTISMINNEIKNLTIKFDGPKDSFYESGQFTLKVTIPDQYPFKPPAIQFMNRVYHPNVSYSSGEICLDILKDNWSPALTLFKTVLSICALLECPNPDSPLNGEAADIYTNNKDSYKKKVLETLTKKE